MASVIVRLDTMIDSCHCRALEGRGGGFRAGKICKGGGGGGARQRGPRGVGGGVKKRRESRNNETTKLGSLAGSREGRGGLAVCRSAVNKDPPSPFMDECEDERQQPRSA